MNMPGFTADASLYRTSAGYHFTAEAYRNGQQQILPQLPDIIGRFLRRACQAACGFAGSQIFTGCVAGSEGTATVACAGAALAFTTACQSAC